MALDSWQASLWWIATGLEMGLGEFVLRGKMTATRLQLRMMLRLDLTLAAELPNTVIYLWPSVTAQFWEDVLEHSV